MEDTDNHDTNGSLSRMLAHKIRPQWLLMATMLALQIHAQSDWVEKSPRSTASGQACHLFVPIREIRVA